MSPVSPQGSLEASQGGHQADETVRTRHQYDLQQDNSRHIADTRGVLPPGSLPRCTLSIN